VETAALRRSGLNPIADLRLDLKIAIAMRERSAVAKISLDIHGWKRDLIEKVRSRYALRRTLLQGHSTKGPNAG
jgi:hypothetical protein